MVDCTGKEHEFKLLFPSFKEGQDDTLDLSSDF